MTAKNGQPCRKCGTSSWHKAGHCVTCKREHDRRWRAENPDKARKASRRWKEDNPDKVAGHTRQWQQNNPEKNTAKGHRYRTSKTQAGGSFTAAEWKTLIKHQDGRCLACGKKAKLTADHVIPVSRGGTSEISNIQGLCKPCNSGKGAKTIDYRKGGGFLRRIQKKLF